jgi:GDPmannose 4,6-dehydratase
MHAVSGIMFNHESPRRGEEFFTRKVTLGIANIIAGKQKVLKLGNLDSYRDWGYAPDYMRAAWLMLQQDEPKDFVIATGETHSTQEWVDKAFAHAGIEPRIEIDQNLIRPAEVNSLKGDPQRIRQQLGWEPSISFDKLVKIMVEGDINLVNGEGSHIR